MARTQTGEGGGRTGGGFAGTRGWAGVLLALLSMATPLLVAAAPMSERWYQPVSTHGLTHGAVLGAVSDTSVRVWARTDGESLLQVEVKRTDEAWPGRRAGDTRLVDERDFAGVVDVTGLAPATGYDYRVLVDGRVAEEGGAFRTLPASGRPGAFRFALGGDLSAEFAPFSILDRVREQRPAFNILLGDLIYADHPVAIPAEVDAYQAKYRANWAEPSFRALARGVPSFMMWDDHEIVNDYDGTEPWRYWPARLAFERYAPGLGPSRNDGALYHAFRVADVEFFVLDTRSHRSPRATPDGSGKTLLGARQKAELKTWLLGSTAPFKLVLSSVPLHEFGQRRPDSWSGYAAERAELLEFVRATGIGGVVFLSGDQHWSSLVRHDPYGVWEFNATPLASHVYGGPLPSDPRLALAYNGSPAFGIVDVDTSGATATMTFTVVDNAGRARGSHTISAARP